MKKYSAVIFDVDGVLLDSLAPHLQICRDKNKEYGLGLSIPNVDEFRNLVRKGVKISPMNFFFRAVGFPDKYAEMAFAQYKEVFMCDYAPKPFPQINEMLSMLASAGFTLGIVTSNVRANVDSALGSNMRLFNTQCIFTMENSDSLPKEDALRLIVGKLDIDAVKLLYVGDQPADWMAAKDAGTDFLGVSYGWGISKDYKEFPVVNTVNGVSGYLLNG